MNTIHYLHTIGRDLSALLHRPSLMDNLVYVITKLLLKLATGRLIIAIYVAVKRTCCGCLLQTDLPDVGVALPDGHRDQRDGQAVEHHHGLQHCAAKFGIGIFDPQSR